MSILIADTHNNREVIHIERGTYGETVEWLKSMGYIVLAIV